MINIIQLLIVDFWNKSSVFRQGKNNLVWFSSSRVFTIATKNLFESYSNLMDNEGENEKPFYW